MLHRSSLLLLLILALPILAHGETPKLNIKLAHNSACEQRTLLQVNEFAKRYDLKKFTLTRDIVIEQGAMAHSKPVLTINCRFLDDDDRALSQYVHEQGHWVLGRRQGELQPLFLALTQAFPNIPTEFPAGGYGVRDSYFHLAVLMLEWQAMEELVGDKRALAVMKWKQGDHYTELYRTVIANRPQMEKILRDNDVHW
jgi:hypothetical protein